MKPYSFHLLWMAFLCMGVVSCSDKYSSIYRSAELPVLSFNKDTMNIREKDYTGVLGWVNPILWMHAVPSLQQLNILYSEPTGRVHFSYRGVAVEDSKPIIVAGDSTSLYCSCDTAGMYKVDFFLTDQLGRVSTKPLIVNCLANDQAKPDLYLELVDSATAGNWYYRLDATKTQKQYGRITGYYFSIDGAAIFSRTAVLDWVFHQQGLHTISLYVTDDLNLHSDTVTQKLLIP